MESIFKKYNINITAEQSSKLEIYFELLRKWQKSINLVSNTTLDSSPTRHFLDSAQLLNYIEDKNIVIADMGTGAGFPGLVLAMLGIKEVHLIESDVRKVQFLKQVSRETKTTNLVFHNDRVENCPIPEVQLVTARALAPLQDLLSWADIINPKASCLFLKGEKTEEEIKLAQKTYSFSPEIFKSLTDDRGNIIRIAGFNKI